jgi:hypothetical protein
VHLCSRSQLAALQPTSSSLISLAYLLYALRKLVVQLVELGKRLNVFRPVLEHFPTRSKSKGLLTPEPP